MAHDELELLINHDGQQIAFKAVKVKDSFLIYKDGKALIALHKSADKWEQRLLEPVSEDLLFEIITKLDEVL